MIRINVAILNTEMLWFYVLLAGVRGQGDVLCKNEATIQPIAAMFTCDGNMTSYADGVKLKDKTSNILTAQNLNIPPNSTVLAIRCHKTRPSPKILGTIGVSIVTSSKGWVCTNEYYPAWNSTKFVDTSWASAVAYWKNELKLPYGKVKNISSAAKWIGTNNSTADALYCRFRLCPPSVCYTLRTTTIDNHRLTGFVFATFHVQHVAKCAMKCHGAHTRCESFNYFSTTGKCELNNSTVLGPPNLVSSPGVTYYYRSN